LAPMMVTYTFQGTQTTNGRLEGVISLQGVASANLGQSMTVTGRLTGQAYFDVAAGQLARATVTAKVEMEKEGKGKMVASLVSKTQRDRGDEIVSQRGALTPQTQKDKNNCHVVQYDLEMEKGVMYHLCLESVLEKGKPQFDARPAVIDWQTKL